MPTRPAPPGASTGTAVVQVKRRPTWTDLALAAATLVGVPTGTVFAGGAVDYAGTVPLAIFLGLALLARRRWPVTVLLVSVQAVIVYRSADLTDVGWVWPASIAYFTAAAVDRGTDRGVRPGLPWAVGIGLVELCFAASWDWSVLGRDPQRALAGVGAEALWLALVLTVGAAYRNWYRWRAELAAGLSRLEHERELESRSRGAEERLRIARELHDVVAHTLTVVGVQLRVVGETLDDSPEEARDALRTAQEVRAKAVGDLRSLIGVLREPGDQVDTGTVSAPQIDLDGLDDLLAGARASGLDLTLDTTGDPAGIPAPVALAAYRVVQESLTNVIRHAGARRATVHLTYAPDLVCVEVVDDGAGPGTQAVQGNGVSGMRERVIALGGTFTAGPADGGSGYAVRATIPVPGFGS